MFFIFGFPSGNYLKANGIEAKRLVLKLCYLPVEMNIIVVIVENDDNF